MVLVLLLLACSSKDGGTATGASPQPWIRLDAPAAADWLPEGAVAVSGAAGEVVEVAVQGQRVELADGAFEGTAELVRGVNVVEATGTAADGDVVFARHGVLAGEFADPDGPVADGAVLRLNRSGIDLVADLAEGWIVPDLVNGDLAAINPVYEDSYTVFGWDAATIRADLLFLDFGPARLAIEPSEGRAALSLTLPDLWVDLEATGDVAGVDFDEWVGMWASEARVEAGLTIGVRDGALQVGIADTSIELVGFGYDLESLPWGIEEVLFLDSVRSTIEETLVEQVESTVPALLDDLLAGLDPSFELDVLGVPLAVEASFTDAGIDADGLWLETDLGAWAPAAVDLPYEGVLQAPPATPSPDRRADISGALADDLVNQLLFQLWRAGLLDLTLSTDDGSLDPLLLLSLQAQEGTIRLAAQLPPVLVEGEGGALQLQLGELSIEVLTPGGGLGERILLAANVFVDLGLEVQGGVLTVDLGTPELVLAVRESDWGASNEATTALLEEMLPIDALLLLVDGFLEVPLPSIEGLVLQSGTAVRDPAGPHTDLELELALE